MWRWSPSRAWMRAGALALASFALLFAGCGGGDEAPETPRSRRVVLVVADGLRARSLGLYGHAGGTSPTLDSFARRAVVFERALTVAPWNLPAFRGLLTGRHPEEYDAATTLAERLSASGFETAFVSASQALSASFAMSRGFSAFQVAENAGAEHQVDQALGILHLVGAARALLVVHLADTVPPFAPPPAHSTLLREAPPAGLSPQFTREEVIGAPRGEQDRQHIEGRYEASVSSIDAQLSRLLAHLDESDIVVITGSHGLELWEHSGFGHGHSVYDELLHVPLLIRAPGIEPGRIDAPVSLLDLAPTLLELLGLEADVDADGRSVAGLLRGDPGTAEALAGRGLVFGRSLFGAEIWGIQHGTTKYVTTRGQERVYDLAVDPEETENLNLGKNWDAAAGYRRRLGEVLGREMRVSFRLAALSSDRPSPEPLVAELECEGGSELVWVADRPGRPALAWGWPEQGRATARWERGFRSTNPVLAVPRAPMNEASGRVVLTLRNGARQMRLPIETTPEQRQGLDRRPLYGSTLPHGGQFLLEYCIAPLPGPDTGRLPRAWR